MVYPACAVTLAMDKPLEEDETLLQDSTIETRLVMLNGKIIIFSDENDHFLHSDGDVSHYFIDKEQKSCLDTYEDCKSHLHTV